VLSRSASRTRRMMFVRPARRSAQLLGRQLPEQLVADLRLGVRNSSARRDSVVLDDLISGDRAISKARPRRLRVELRLGILVRVEGALGRRQRLLERSTIWRSIPSPYHLSMAIEVRCIVPPSP
jgi:hypothetical protein